MKRLGKILGVTLVSILSLFGIAFIALIIYYWPVIDRLYVRPCHYYPNAFSDCIEKNN